MRQDFESVGGMIEPVSDLGDEAYSASVFPVGETIQRVVLFRTEALTGAVHYTDIASAFTVEDVVELARRMERKGAGAARLRLPMSGWGDGHNRI
jgi:hypothetical protein